MIQIWTMLTTIYVLIVLKDLDNFKSHFSNLVAFIRLNLILKIDLQLWLDKLYQSHEINQSKANPGGTILKYINSTWEY